MLQLYIQAREAANRLRTDETGVVSFEYIIVAACIIGAVFAAFGNSASAGIGLALSNGIQNITTAFSNALGG